MLEVVVLAIVNGNGGSLMCCCSSVVERVLGKDEAMGSSPISS
jgi:hypothetical protein